MQEVFQNAAITLLVFLEIMYVRFANIKNKYEESRLTEKYRQVILILWVIIA